MTGDTDDRDAGRDSNAKRLKKTIRGILVGILLLLATLPIFAPGLMGGLTIYQSRMLGIVLVAVILWVTEPIPVFATGLVIVLLELILLSDKAPVLLKIGAAPLEYKAVLGNFASPIIVLFLGGFALAAAANKYKIDRAMARTLLGPFGTRPSMIMLGIMGITAVFSMFMSNTATTAMMLAILAPVVAGMPAGDPGRKGLLLAVPLAANVGGMGTPIGTPRTPSPFDI